MGSIVIDVGLYTGHVIWFVGKTIVIGTAAVVQGVVEAAIATAPSEMPPPVVLQKAKISVEYDANAWALIKAFGGDSVLATLAIVVVTAVTTYKVVDYLFLPSKQPILFVPNNHVHVNAELLNLDLLPVHLADHEHEECVICRSNKWSILFNACGHLVCCAPCAKLVVDKKCPLCRKVSTDFVHVIT